MKLMKMLGLASLAALVAMAFVGASPATAETTALCTTDESPCASGNQASHYHWISFLLHILSSSSTVLCETLRLGDPFASLASPLVIQGAFTYSNCLRGSEKCTVSEVNGPGSMQVLKEGHETAKVTFEYEISVKCGFFISCTYNGEGLAGTAKGPLLSGQANGSIAINEQEMTKVGGSFCPSSAKLDFEASPLTATYISG